MAHFRPDIQRRSHSNYLDGNVGQRIQMFWISFNTVIKSETASEAKVF